LRYEKRLRKDGVPRISINDTNQKLVNFTGPSGKSARAKAEGRQIDSEVTVSLIMGLSTGRARNIAHPE
jgi:hypothetical protein